MRNSLLKDFLVATGIVAAAVIAPTAAIIYGAYIHNGRDWDKLSQSVEVNPAAQSARPLPFLTISP